MAYGIPLPQILLYPLPQLAPEGARTCRRQQARTKLVLPVKIALIDGKGQFSTCTLDASPAGLLLHTRSLEPGQVVLVDYRATRCRYRVAWVADPEDELPERCGLESIDGKSLIKAFEI